jgi:pimeloyl-ACP methyl ester carboxylesterase
MPDDSKPVAALRLASGVGGFALCVLMIAAAYQWISHRRDLRENPAPGRLIDVGGYRMHIDCVGQGSPTVILDSGLSDSSLSWFKVQPKVARFTRVCSYDRAGLGWSDESPHRRESQVFAEELHTLLHNGGIQPPLILVGHSMGGFDALIYAHLYPDEVKGMVLVDSAYPDLANRLPELKTSLSEWRKSLEREEYSMPFGLPRLLRWCGSGAPDLAPKLRTVECDRSWIKETIAESRSMWNESAAQAGSVRSLGKIPLIVISEDPARNVKEFLPEFEKGQEALVHLSADGSRVIAIGSGHQIQKERPDTVISGVRKLWVEIRKPGGNKG